MVFRGTRSTARALGAALGVVLLLSVGLAAWGAPRETATEAIRQGNDRLRSLLAEKAETPTERERINAQITRELRGLFDIDFLAERSLVDHWQKMTPKQRAEVQRLLRSIIERNYLSQLRGNLNYRIDYPGEQAATCSCAPSSAPSGTAVRRRSR